MPPPLPPSKRSSLLVESWKVGLGLAIVLLGLGLGLYVWQRALSQIVDLHTMKARDLALERRVSGLEERLAAVEQALPTRVPGP